MSKFTYETLPVGSWIPSQYGDFCKLHHKGAEVRETDGELVCEGNDGTWTSSFVEDHNLEGLHIIPPQLFL